MVGSLNSALRIATAGMQVNQQALGVVTHNISNVNTEGYSRQTAKFSAVSFNGIGDGVELDTVLRTIDTFLEKRILGKIADNSYNKTRSTFISNLESVFGNPLSGSGLNDLMSKMFSDINALSNNPDSLSQKRNVLQQAQLVSENLRNTNIDLTASQSRIESKIDEEISTVNQIIKNINDLNVEINAETSGINGANANDLKDQRQRQIDELAKHISITTASTQGDGVRVLTNSGRQLLDIGTYTQLERTSGSPYANIGIRKIQVDGTPSASILELDTSQLTGGSIKALVDVRDTTIPNLIEELDELSTGLRVEFNKIHSRGSSFPPQNSLQSGNTSGIANITTDLFTTFPDLASDTFDISIVDSTGDTVVTTKVTGLAITGTGPITIPSTGPFTLTDLQNLINNNADVGVTSLGAGLGATATAGVDSDGNPIITMAATNTNLRIVLSNTNTSATNDPLGLLGMNNFFTGTDSSNINIRTDIVNNPSLIATARMRESDGGISSLDNRNVLELGQMIDSEISFSAAGTLAARTDTLAGYSTIMLSNFAVIAQDAENRKGFTEASLFELSEKRASVSGVNLDEELAQMIVFQNSFQASARVITTVNELMQTLINIIR